MKPKTNQLAGSAPWYPSDVNLINDVAVMRMIDQLQMEGYGIYHFILGWLCSQPGYAGSLEQAKYMAKRMGCSEAKFMAVINGYDLFRLEGDRFFSTYLDEKMLPYERRRKAAQKAVTQRWSQQKELPISSESHTIVLPTYNDRNTDKIRGDKIREDNMRLDNKEKGKRKSLSLSLDFITSEKMKEIWVKWMEYKKQIKKPYKTQSGMEAKFKHLLELSGGDTAMAEKIIDQSIREEWAGLFPLKESLCRDKPGLRPAIELYAERYGL
jgi:hypothetical protein